MQLQKEMTKQFKAKQKERGGLSADQVYFKESNKEIMEIINRNFSTRYPRYHQHPERSWMVLIHRKLQCRPHSLQGLERGVGRSLP